MDRTERDTGAVNAGAVRQRGDRFGAIESAFLLAFLACLGACASGCRGHARDETRPGPQVLAAGRYGTEQEWVVGRTLQWLAGLATHARRGPAIAPSALMPEVKLAGGPDDPGAPRFAVHWNAPGLPRELTVTAVTHLWSPATYEPGVRSLLGAQEGKARPAARSGSVLAPLVDLQTPTLEAEDRKVSQALAEDGSDPDAHEEAAFLLGAFALREAAGAFQDVREALCRMVAHLALAHVLRGGAPLSAEGRLAEVMLLVLVDRQRDAVAALEALPRADGREEQAWRTALRMRVTLDWRLLQQPEKATLVERITYVRAVAERLGSARAESFMDVGARETIPDWGRVTMSGMWPSVEDCGRFGRAGVGWELADFARLANTAPSSPNDLTALVQRLDTEPAPAPVIGARSVQVLDRGLWAASTQRHLMFALMNMDQCEREMYGNVKTADAQGAEVDRAFGSLRLYPLFRKRRSASTSVHAREDYDKAMAKGVALTVARPELISPSNWVCFHEPPATLALPPTLPTYKEWFQPRLPFGTALDAWNRLRAPGGHPYPPAAAVQTVHALAPWDRGLAWAALEAVHGHHVPYAALVENFGLFSDYDAGALRGLADASGDAPARQEELHRKRCDLVVDTCNSLADHLAAHGRLEEAIALDRKFFEGARDRVKASNQARRLVDWDFEHGRKQEALSVAQRAAEVASYGGIETLALLLEKMGRYGEAAKRFEEIKDHYGNVGQLIAFYNRRAAAGATLFAGRREAALKELFPAGMEKASLADFSSPPRDGLIMRGGSGEMNKVGLRENDIVVALDGTRVHSYEQYDVVRGMLKGTEMALIVWSQGHYREVRASPPNHLFGVDMPTYQR